MTCTGIAVTLMLASPFLFGLFHLSSEAVRRLLNQIAFPSPGDVGRFVGSPYPQIVVGIEGGDVLVAQWGARSPAYIEKIAWTPANNRNWLPNKRTP